MTTVEAGFEERSGGEFLFDFDTFEKIDKLGIFERAEGRVELIDGRLLEMSPISGDHGEISGGVFFRLKAAVMALGLEDTFKLIVRATLKIGESSAPEVDGTWASVTVLDGDAYVSPLFSSEIHIPLSELF